MYCGAILGLKYLDNKIVAFNQRLVAWLRTIFAAENANAVAKATFQKGPILMSERWIEETFHPDWKTAMRADEVLHEVKTEHQDLVIFKNKTWGTVLILDGVFQLSTVDEFVYHEMMAHVPLFALDAPKTVLIIGGGDGGVLRECLKHPSVEKVTLCEIDRAVIDLSVEHFPSVSAGAFGHPKTNLVIADGFQYVQEQRRVYDAVIVDSSEPIGPSAILHTREFFAACQAALKPDGILIAQNGLPFFFHDHLSGTTRVFASLFEHVAPYFCHQPCYFGGPLAINFGTNNTDAAAVTTNTLAKRQTAREISELKYWTPETHTGAFAMPAYAELVISDAIASGRAQGDKAEGYATIKDVLG